VGKMADIEFLVGTNTTHLKRGQITGVGTNYIVIREFDTGRTMVGDFSNIKFVTIYDDLN
ncbi:MAG: alginate lyase, partial [Clostridia bacterium]|nr:alginate lyase [Clostridia bacterium]